jgi:hypothetical protein
MSKDSGYLVETKTGKKGRTYHREGLIKGKMIVHIEGEDKPLLCVPEAVKITGFID